MVHFSRKPKLEKALRAFDPARCLKALLAVDEAVLAARRNAALAREYEADAESVMKQAGLSDEERRALIDKDYDAIKRLTGLTDGQFATNHLVRAYDE